MVLEVHRAKFVRGIAGGIFLTCMAFALQGCEVSSADVVNDPSDGTGGNGGKDDGDNYYTVIKEISDEDLADKIKGYWVGQLVGNYMALPFAAVDKYSEEPMPVTPTQYYDGAAASFEGLTTNPLNQWIPEKLSELRGAYTDDDTDIEFITLHAVEQYGIDISYAQIAERWKKHIGTVNGSIWVWRANAKAWELMGQGKVPPETGAKANNAYWHDNDPQLVNEIWSVFYPGMLEDAAKRAEWGAQITSADWGTHPTIFYAVLYSAAFFMTDVSNLYDIALGFVPTSSPFYRGLKRVKALHSAEPNDWRLSWYKIHHEYYDACNGCEEGIKDKFSAIINGLMGALAFLYGGGDFTTTVGIATAAGYSSENQAATIGGVLGVMYGCSKIPVSLTHNVNGNQWLQVFNNKYFNRVRKDIPYENAITDIVKRIKKITRDVILAKGGEEVDLGYNVKLKVKVSAKLNVEH